MTDIAFFSDEWAQRAREEINAGPTADERAKKLDEYWNFVDLVRGLIQGSIAIGALDIPGTDGPRYLLLRFGEGSCQEATITDEAGVESANYVLEGAYDDWVALIEGYDVGKTVMYRKLLLVRGPLLDFFKGIYYFVESLACLQRIPTAFPEPAPAAPR